MSREISVRIWQASRYNPQYQDVDAEQVLKTLKYIPKSPSYDNTSIKLLLSTIADWAKKMLRNGEADNDEFLLKSYIENAEYDHGDSFFAIGYNNLPENDYLYYDILATIITKCQELDLVILLDIYGKEIFIYPDGISEPMPNYVDYIFQRNKETRETKESYNNELAFDALLNMPRPNSVEQGEIFVEACFKDYAERNGLEYRGKIHVLQADAIGVILAVNDIRVICIVNIGRRGDYIYYIEFMITPNYEANVPYETFYKLGSPILTTYQPSAKSDYQVNLKTVQIFYDSRVEEKIFPQSQLDLVKQKTPQRMYEVLCHYLERVINVAKSSNSYLDFLDRIYQDSNNVLHNYYWWHRPKDLIENKPVRMFRFAVVHRMGMLQTMATLLHPELPKMLALLAPEITGNFEDIRRDFVTSYAYLLPYLDKCQTSQDFFNHIMRIYEDGLKGINYPPLEE